MGIIMEIPTTTPPNTRATRDAEGKRLGYHTQTPVQRRLVLDQPIAVAAVVEDPERSIATLLRTPAVAEMPTLPSSKSAFPRVYVPDKSFRCTPARGLSASSVHPIRRLVKRCPSPSRAIPQRCHPHQAPLQLQEVVLPTKQFLVVVVVVVVHRMVDPIINLPHRLPCQICTVSTLRNSRTCLRLQA